MMLTANTDNRGMELLEMMLVDAVDKRLVLSAVPREMLVADTSNRGLGLLEMLVVDTVNGGLLLLEILATDTGAGWL